MKEFESERKRSFVFLKYFRRNEMQRAISSFLIFYLTCVARI